MTRTRRWGPFRQEWYSPCSLHQNPNPTCRLCQDGEWENAWKVAVGQEFYRLCPGLWRAWANRERVARYFRTLPWENFLIELNRTMRPFGPGK